MKPRWVLKMCNIDKKTLSEPFRHLVFEKASRAQLAGNEPPPPFWVNACILGIAINSP